jgi:hypothetical protein
VISHPKERTALNRDVEGHIWSRCVSYKDVEPNLPEWAKHHERLCYCKTLENGKNKDMKK